MRNEDELRKHIENAFDLIFSVSVSGDDVDKIAFAKENLRAAHKLLSVEHEFDAKEAIENGG